MDLGPYIETHMAAVVLYQVIWGSGCFFFDFGQQPVTVHCSGKFQEKAEKRCIFVSEISRLENGHSNTAFISTRNSVSTITIEDN